MTDGCVLPCSSVTGGPSCTAGALVRRCQPPSSNRWSGSARHSGVLSRDEGPYLFGTGGCPVHHFWPAVPVPWTGGMWSVPYSDLPANTGAHQWNTSLRPEVHKGEGEARRGTSPGLAGPTGRYFTPPPSCAYDLIPLHDMLQCGINIMMHAHHACILYMHGVHA